MSKCNIGFHVTPIGSQYNIDRLFGLGQQTGKLSISNINSRAFYSQASKQIDILTQRR